MMMTDKRERSRSRSRQRDSESQQTQEQKSATQQSSGMEEEPITAPTTKKNRNIYIKDLPKKPVRQNGVQGYRQVKRDLTVTTNNFKINFKGASQLFIYSVKFLPEIARDNRMLRRGIIMSGQAQLQKEIGQFLLSGSVLFSLKEPDDISLGVQINVPYQNTCYELTVKKVKTVNMKDLDNPDPKVNQLPVKWFNILVKTFLRQMGYFEYGRTAKFYDMKKKTSVQETRLNILVGYATSFHVLESGLNLKIDMSHRIIRQDNALLVIQQIYKDYQHKNKDERRQLVRDELIGSQVIVNYGNYRIYQIDDLLFDKDIEQFELELNNSQTMTIDKYYQTKYNFNIKDKRAPLLISKSKDNKLLYLIPELCIMSGMPKNINEFQRKKISQNCISDPWKRLEAIQGLVKAMLNTSSRDEVSSEQIKNMFGIEISSEPQRVQAKQLQPPRILFGQNKVLTETFNGGFNTNKFHAYRSGDPATFAVIHPFDFPYNEFERCFIDFCKALNIRSSQDIKRYKLGENTNLHLRDIEEILRTRVAGNFSIVIIILDNNTKKHYSQIKQYCLVQQSIISQVVLTETLRRKSFPVIIAKLVQQILSKIGRTVWAIQNPEDFPQRIMTMSVIVLGSPDRTQGIVSFCATIDKEQTVFFNQVMIVDKSQCTFTIKCMDQLLQKCLEAYYNHNKYYPDSLLYFREALDDEAIQNILEDEIPTIQSTINKVMGDNQLKMTVISLQKSMRLRFFFDNNGKVGNPPFGTVVDQSIVSKNYEFYMVSQHAGRGSVSPTLYRVVYDTMKLPMEMLQDFIFGQCFNYYNWSGAIRVPAIVQNATKLSRFIKETLCKEPSTKMQAYLYYL